MQRARKSRGKATSQKVKSKEIVDDVASDDSNKDKDENSTDVKRKRQSDKTKSSSVDKDGKPTRKRQTKNKVHRKHSLLYSCCCSGNNYHANPWNVMHYAWDSHIWRLSHTLMPTVEIWCICEHCSRILLKIFVMILLTLDAVCVFCFVLNFVISVYVSSICCQT